jgi:hypothetical protein
MIYPEIRAPLWLNILVRTIFSLIAALSPTLRLRLATPLFILGLLAALFGLQMSLRFRLFYGAVV